jgi:hypothetical protein
MPIKKIRFIGSLAHLRREKCWFSGYLWLVVKDSDFGRKSSRTKRLHGVVQPPKSRMPVTIPSNPANRLAIR